MNVLAVVGKQAHMRRTLVRMGVDPDEWLEEVTGRRRESLVLPRAPPSEPQEEPEEDDDALVEAPL
eukprot:11386900-Prorocentrum_lima.AAC.1